jgi:LSD1 subclass zinc finger protein
MNWARLIREGHYPLRRGAWYRVTRVTSTEVVLIIRQRPTTVPRDVVELVATAPPTWSVVPRPAKADRLPDSWGDHYGVCPGCRTRAALQEGSESMRCPRCNGLFQIAWDEAYLDRK